MLDIILCSYMKLHVYVYTHVYIYVYMYVYVDMYVIARFKKVVQRLEEGVK